ncbi:MAG: hypothetical protein CVV30_10340 [Methanomicrobiales archaeon HGW-Methanomicrobiales-1]|nr:MAG: hypothetical protein CVV30_10340 [Methanomicrobiales archaeon HGW-Methanomicrobiales-1]
MTIGIGQNENPTDVSVEVMGLGQDLDQTYTTIDPRSDTTPYSARTFISLDKTLIHLKPGIPEKVTATITLPKDVGSGGRYASIYIYAVPAQGQIGQTMTTAAIVPVAITISGTTPTITGSITSVDVGEVVVGQPISVTTSFKNTGNYYAVSPINQVKILDLKGNIIANSSTAPSGYAVIPGNTVQYVLKPDAKTLQQGSYTIDSKILLASGKVLDEKMTPFTVKSNYVPPITESNITLTPGSAGTLTSPDSRYSVSFPQGAVLGDAVVTLKPYSNEKLHAAPANAKLGATSFEITGLSGLLSKDATVKVKYSADDLTAAGGDVSKLKLSYYDAAQNAWVILPTQVDSTGMILTTTTNHLSVWAVMVSSSTTGSPASVSAPVATTAKGSPLPLTVILISLAIAVLAAGYHTGKKK